MNKKIAISIAVCYVESKGFYLCFKIDSELKEMNWLSFSELQLSICQPKDNHSFMKFLSFMFPGVDSVYIHFN